MKVLFLILFFATIGFAQETPEPTGPDPPKLEYFAQVQENRMMTRTIKKYSNGFIEIIEEGTFQRRIVKPDSPNTGNQIPEGGGQWVNK